jgi:hypothetical protein
VISNKIISRINYPTRYSILQFSLAFLLLVVHVGASLASEQVIWTDSSKSKIELVCDSLGGPAVRIVNQQYLFAGTDKQQNFPHATRFPLLLRQEILETQQTSSSFFRYQLHTTAYSLDSSTMGRKIWEIRNGAQFGEVYPIGLYHIMRKGCCDLLDLNYLYNVQTGNLLLEYTGKCLYLKCNGVERMCGFRSRDTYGSYDFEKNNFYLGLVIFSSMDSIMSKVAIFEEDTGQVERNGSQVVLSSKCKSASGDQGKKRNSTTRFDSTLTEKWNGKIELNWRHKTISIDVVADTFNISKTPVQNLIFKRIR